MRAIEIQVTVATDGKLEINPPVNLPSGKYNAVLVMEDQPLPSSPTSSLETAQALFRQYVPADRSLSEELIQNRRAEAFNE